MQASPKPEKTVTRVTADLKIQVVIWQRQRQFVTVHSNYSNIIETLLLLIIVKAKKKEEKGEEDKGGGNKKGD